MKTNEVKRLRGLCSGRYIVATTSPDKGRSFFPECQHPHPEFAAREVANVSEIENAVRVAQTYTFTDLHGRTVYPEILDLETGESAGTWCLDCGAFVPVDTWHQHEEKPSRLGPPVTDTLLVVLDRDYATTEAQVIAERCPAPGPIPAFCRAEPAPAPTTPLAGAVDFQKLDERCIGLMRAVYVWPDGQWRGLGECGPESGGPSLDDCVVFRFPAYLSDYDITALIAEATIPPAEPALLPCPFCDSTDIFVKNEGGDRPGTTSVTCRWCGANTGLWAERVQAVAAWNSRKPTTEKVK